MAYSYLERLNRTIKAHEDWRLTECLNLEPAENRTSPQTRSAFLSDLGNRYTDPEDFHRGTRYLDELVSLTEEIARKVFRARYANVSPLSGHVADMAVLFALTEPGNRVLSVSPKDGGYPGITQDGLGRLLKLENSFFPYDDEAVNVEPKGSARLIETASPKVIFFGSSFIPFPHPTRKLSEAAAGTCVYDGSHVLGLIAGGVFQDPLREGCSLLIGSTHKSFPGPQGGIILSNSEEIYSRVSSKLYYGAVDNIHLDRIAALAIALLEMMQFGKPYAEAVVKNSKAVAKALVDEGVKVRGASHGYTESHQALLDYHVVKLASLAKKLEEANIISDSGGRIGTAELTRMGFGPSEMEEVAELVAMVVLGKKPVDFVKSRVKSLVRQFQEPKYVLKDIPRLP
ncbi:MAG: serine hydroxymethyltransferase [Thaumarchaeota archaeon]|nr:serine hydroxymethyltransferase [Nitrososphaerota archaeon]